MFEIETASAVLVRSLEPLSYLHVRWMRDALLCVYQETLSLTNAVGSGHVCRVQDLAVSSGFALLL